MQEIADILKISKSIKLLVEIKKRVFYCMEKDHENFLTNPVMTNFKKLTLPIVSGVGRCSLEALRDLAVGRENTCRTLCNRIT